METRSALENLDAILEVPELGFVWIGVNDLCTQLGRPGNRDHPVVLEAIETIEGKTRDANVPLAGIPRDVDDAQAPSNAVTA